MFISYQIKHDGIEAFRPPFHKKLFRYSDLLDAKLVTQEQAAELINHTMEEQNSYATSADIIGYFKMIRKRSPVYRYFTFTVKPIDPRLKGEQTKGGMIVLFMRDESVYYISPIHPERFMVSLNKIWPNQGSK